jgi:hypothetical protein
MLLITNIEDRGSKVFSYFYDEDRLGSRSDLWKFLNNFNKVILSSPPIESAFVLKEGGRDTPLIQSVNS